MANQIKGKVTEQVETRLSDQKTRAAETVGTVADTLRSSSQQLSDSGQDGVSRYIERAADQAERFASYLDSTEVSEVVDRVEDFARRQPAAFMAGAFAVGFLASRFLKSGQSDAGYRSGYTSDRERSAAFESGSNFEYGTPSRYEAGSNANAGTGSNRDVVGDPSVRTSVGLETGSQHRENRDIVGDPSARTSVGLETNERTNRGDI